MKLTKAQEKRFEKAFSENNFEFFINKDIRKFISKELALQKKEIIEKVDNVEGYFETRSDYKEEIMKAIK